MNKNTKRQLYWLVVSAYRKLIFGIVKWKTVIACNVCLEPGSYYDTKTVFEGDNYLGRNVFLDCCSVGKGSYVAAESYLIKTEIGRYCSIGHRVTTAIGEHKYKSGFSTSPSFFSHEPINGLSVRKDDFAELKYSNPTEGYCITIENDVWVGSGAVLLSGITLKTGSVIGAGSVVTKDTEPYGIYAGNPAKRIGFRFSEEMIDYLMKTKWWEMDIDKLKEFSNRNGY